MGRPTITDVATAAGVSKGAVSFALNGRPGISEETRRRILATAEDLGWTPSARARALSSLPLPRGRAGPRPATGGPQRRRLLPGLHRGPGDRALRPRTCAAAPGRRARRPGHLPPARPGGPRRRRPPHGPPGGRRAPGAARGARPAVRADRPGALLPQLRHPVGRVARRRGGHPLRRPPPGRAGPHPHRARGRTPEPGSRPLATSRPGAPASRPPACPRVRASRRTSRRSPAPAPWPSCSTSRTDLPRSSSPTT